MKETCEACGEEVDVELLAEHSVAGGLICCDCLSDYLDRLAEQAMDAAISDNLNARIG